MKLLSLFFLIILCSCTNRRGVRLELTDLTSKPITIPSLLQVANDSFFVNSSDSKLRLIEYTDSTGCSSCNLAKMYLWSSLLEYSKKYNGKLKFYFIFSPVRKEVKQFEMSIRNRDMPYPIFLDTLGEFAKLNPHLPKNRALHTFLLDENDNVILVGNPLRNKKIEEMFYKIVEERLGKTQ